MEFFTASYFKVALLVFYLFVILFIVLLSSLYLMRTTRATKAIGLHAPEYIKILVRVSIINALATAFLIAFFLITNIY